MRTWLIAHAHSITACAVFFVVALTMGATMGTSGAAGPTLSAIPAPPMPLPSPEFDADRDSFHDDVDVVDGDAHVTVTVTHLQAGDILPYMMIGTQDDHWRFGAGRELEWRRVIDPDALGNRPGSQEWYASVARTGAWWLSTPMPDEGKIMARTGELSPGADNWPQTFHVNVRDDQEQVDLTLELYDARPSPEPRIAQWQIRVNLTSGAFAVDDGIYLAGAQAQTGLATFTVAPSIGLSRSSQEEIAARWSPNLHFDGGEVFFPVRGEAMQRFHGFSRTAEADRDLRTWMPSFNNGRDSYVLLLADFNGDRNVDHLDAAVMTDVLREGGLGDTVYAQVARTTGDRVVVQYWFIYAYNFVEDEQGETVDALAHRGDREFITLVFDSEDEARAGAPASIAYSQHYGGIRMDAPDIGAAPFNGTHPDVFVARGSHASYPAAGDDRRFRPALSGHFDVFDGLGEAWTAEDYRLELLDSQSWAFGHLWGPTTRASRDFGTTGRPLLKHDFTYPYLDPLTWLADMRPIDQDDIHELYGGRP